MVNFVVIQNCVCSGVLLSLIVIWKLFKTRDSLKFKKVIFFYIFELDALHNSVIFTYFVLYFTLKYKC